MMLAEALNGRLHLFFCREDRRARGATVQYNACWRAGRVVLRRHSQQASYFAARPRGVGGEAGVIDKNVAFACRSCGELLHLLSHTYSHVVCTL